MSTLTIALPDVSLKKRYHIAFHVLCWLVLTAWLFYYLHNNGNLSFFRSLDVSVGIFFNILIFYLNSYLLIPKFLAHNRILHYTVYMLLTLLLIALIRQPLDYYVFRDFNQHMSGIYTSELSLQYLVGGLINVFISSAVKVTGNYIRNESRNKELEKQKLTAELAYLKSQVNPHFLFNTLNNIYSLAYKQSPETPDAIMKLSLLMRYMLYESNDTLVSLQKEVEHINNFIDLQKLRLREHASIRFNVTGDTTGKVIAPMMMMTLVENAFKHGLVSKNEVGITITLDVKEEYLQFSTVNNISVNKKKGFGGIGLENLKQRLNMLYPNRHMLIFEEKESVFYATLKVYFKSKS